MQRLLPILLLLTSACALSTPAHAQADSAAEKVADWRKLANEGNANAQYNLGLMYDRGQGVPQDHAEAVRWYRLAAEQGSAAAQLNLGVKYGNGQGVPQDFAEAVRWYRLAAEQGNATAQFNLGLQYAKGQGVPKNYVAAYMWSSIADSAGDERGKKLRDIVERGLSQPNLLYALRLVNDCKAKNYKNCFY